MSSGKINIAVYPGTFDPITNGHFDLIERGARMFDKVVIAVAASPGKSPNLDLETRMALVKKVCASLPNVDVIGFSTLLTTMMHEQGATIILRGLRAVSDFEYELQIAHANSDLDPTIDTIFLPTRTNYGFISASLVREISSHGGDVSRYAPPEVCEALSEKFST